jgi:hypothetical protein
MPRKAKDILKARGYTEEELTGLATMLNDPKFVGALEAEDAERERITLEHQKAQADLAATTKWYHEEAVPTLNKALGDATLARSERAKLEAQIKAEQDYGMRRVATQDNQPPQTQQTQQPPNGQQSGQNPFEQTDQRYITSETFKEAFNQTGTAIAMAQDIADDHRDLFGKRIDGGVGGLRQKYLAASETGFRGTLRQFWEKEYNVDQKRAELAQKEREAHDTSIRQDERTKVMSEFANPMTRSPESSRSPFMRKVIAGGTSDGKQPWERGTVEQRRSERVVKFGTKVLTGRQAG